MLHIVRHTPNREKPNEVVYFGPFDSRDLAERYCSHMDWKMEDTKISTAVPLLEPEGSPETWPAHVSPEEVGIDL